MRTALLAPLLTALGGCATGDGGFLLELLPDTLSAQVGSQPGRFSSDGWLQTAEGYALRLDGLVLDAEGLTLLGVAGDPTPGGSGAPRPLVTLLARAPVPVAVRTPATPLGGVPLGPCTPGCGLERGVLGEARLVLLRLRAEGMVRDRSGRRLGAQTALSVDLALGGDGLALRQALALRLDRDAPERLALRVLAELTPALGDGVDWAALPRKGAALCLGSQPPCEVPEAAARIQQNLAQSTLTVDLGAPQQ